MTLREVYQLGKKQAQSGEIGAYCTDFDVLCLFEHCFGRDRQALIVHGAERASRPQMETFFSLLKKKAAGEPLQYLLGSWGFMDMELAVGPGVLIPREDTIPLVLETVQRLKNFSAPVILDLCAGTGAVGLGVARELPDAKVICVELSPLALPYLAGGKGRRAEWPGWAFSAAGGCGCFQSALHLYRRAAGAAKGSAAGAAAGFGRRPGWTKLLPGDYQ